nr:MAG TPA: hypothetical protein [Caudoviricetes sp.]
MLYLIWGYQTDREERGSCATVSTGTEMCPP